MKIGKKYKYISETIEHSFEFMVIGSHPDNIDILINKESPVIFKIKKSELLNAQEVKKEKYDI